MGGKRKGVAWRRPFLHALSRTGNVRLAAEAAGVDYTTAYALRKRDGRFAGAWERALGRAKESVRTPFDPSTELRTGFAQDERRDRRGSPIGPSPSHPLRGRAPPSPPRGRGDEVVRISKTYGPQVVRAHEGRWSEAKEKLFFQALFDSGNVRAAAAAVGMSTTAIYNRRRNNEGFAEAWDAVLSESKVQLEMSMIGAANRALDGIDPAEPPKLSTREAVAVFTSVRKADMAARGRQPHRAPRIATNAEVRAALVKGLKAFGARVTAEEAAGDGGSGALPPPRQQ